ncbi:uncharacterized protein IL334_001263 [Kwoniella shivajii]|uniref:Zn(2)-C6 fungal-type domain-containing protein n=1 Tax=Kwoniella shivajii TaxID=564305 RepID=A0ABZ1CRG0_9TREE|nr:hypothetical protein IL334_001263 [Kwoniella shivajii]
MIPTSHQHTAERHRKGTFRPSIPIHSPSMSSVQSPITISAYPQYAYNGEPLQYSHSPSPQTHYQASSYLHPHPYSYPHPHVHTQSPSHSLPQRLPRKSSDQTQDQTASMFPNSHSAQSNRATTFPPKHHPATGSPQRVYHATRSSNSYADDHSPPPDAYDNQLGPQSHHIPNRKKRSRDLSGTKSAIPDHPQNITSSSTTTTTTHSLSNTSPPLISLTPTKGTFWKSEQSSTTVNEIPAFIDQSAGSIPSVLTREKKPKACSGCRKAKLKCIVEQGNSDCIRCQARKERCLFFPRSNDEESQLKLHHDLYEATRHLNQLSKAVHHILHHLVEKNIIPPFVSDDHPGGLEKYDHPKQVSSLDEGQNFMVTREHTPSKKKRRKAIKREDADDDELDQSYEEPSKAHRLKGNRGKSSSTSIVDLNLPSSSDLDIEVLQRSNSISERPRILTRPPSTIVSSPVVSSPNLPPDIPPNRPSSKTPPLRKSPIAGWQNVQPSIGQVLSSNEEGWNIGQPPSIYEVNTRTNAPRNRFSCPPDLNSGIKHDRIVSSPRFTLVPSVPNMYIEKHVSYSQTSTAAIQSKQSVSHMTEDLTPMVTPEQKKDDPKVVIGSQDPRKDIVKKDLIPRSDALSLVKYFHHNISTFIYGHPLQFYQFPYIAGPQYITPLLLAVLCLISSERTLRYHHHHSLLAEEVSSLLKTSPAESWQTFIGHYTPDFGDPDGDDPLEPEFGLGPEEIVAACILATYMTEREQAALIARSAFRWARGWIKLLQTSPGPRNTIAALAGIIPPERPAGSDDMARIWLLCYIVDSTERLQISLDAPPHRDAESFCRVLIPSNGSDHISTEREHTRQDFLLTFHARLMIILNQWRDQLKSLVSASQPPTELVRGLKQLARNVNQNLILWKTKLDSTSSPTQIQHEDGEEQWKKHVLITYYFVRMSVNSTLSKYLPPPPSLSDPSNNNEDHRSISGSHARSSRNGVYETIYDDHKLRETSKNIVIKSAMSFMTICKSWEKPESLINLSPTYLYFVTLMGSELVESIKEDIDRGKESSLRVDDVILLLKSVGEMLLLGELDQQHVSRTTAKTLFSYCERLQKLR